MYFIIFSFNSCNFIIIINLIKLFSKSKKKIDDLYVLFARKIRVLNHLSSYDSISDFNDYINHYIYCSF